MMNDIKTLLTQLTQWDVTTYVGPDCMKLVMSKEEYKSYENIRSSAANILERLNHNNSSSTGIDPFGIEDIDSPSYDGQAYGGFPEAPMKHENDF